MPLEYYRWKMAERFGWTLEYVDSLTFDVIHELIQVDNGKHKANASILKK